MSLNTGEIWGRRDHGNRKIRSCDPYHVIDKLDIGAGTGQIHSYLGMRCVNINDIGLPNPSTHTNTQRLGQKKLGNSGMEQSCPPGSYLNRAVIHHDNTTGKNANVQQIQVSCRDPDNQTTAGYQAGVNTGKNITTVSCPYDSYFNEVLFSEGGTNINGIGFNCFDAAEIVNDDGWRRIDCCRNKKALSDECGHYYEGPGGACGEFAREFCSAGNNWMMPACVKWSEDHSTDMDSFYTTRCKSLTTPTNPIQNGNFVTLKFENGKYLNIEFGKPVLSHLPLEFRIIDTGLRYEGDGLSEPIYEFTTVEDFPKYLQIYNYIDEIPTPPVDSSFEAINRNFRNKNTDFDYGNPFQFLIREVNGAYWIEKFAVRITSSGVERFPVYLSYEGDKVISSETPSFIEIENFDRGRVVCSCINAIDYLPPLLSESAAAVGAQAFCFSQDCITGGGYKTEGQKREPCNQVLTICSANVNIEPELEEGGVDIGQIIIDQNCGPDDGPSLGEPAPTNEDITRLVMIFGALFLFILLLK